MVHTGCNLLRYVIDLTTGHLQLFFDLQAQAFLEVLSQEMHVLSRTVEQRIHQVASEAGFRPLLLFGSRPEAGNSKHRATPPGCLY